MPIDILSGDDRLRTWLNAQSDLEPEQIDALCDDGVAQWRSTSQDHWLYGDR